MQSSQNEAVNPIQQPSSFLPTFRPYTPSGDRITRGKYYFGSAWRRLLRLRALNETEVPVEGLDAVRCSYSRAFDKQVAGASLSGEHLLSPSWHDCNASGVWTAVVDFV